MATLPADRSTRRHGDEAELARGRGPAGDDDPFERALAEERLGRRPRGASRLAQSFQATGPSVSAAFQHEALG
jgi:hypothetical protein